MSISPGTRLGSYEATALIGAGGLGAVYPRSARARSRLRSARPRIITGLRLLCVLAALGQFFLPDLAHAQDGSALPSDAAEPAVPEKAGKELRAFRITGSSPQIDGRLDEEVWAAADAIDDLVQGEPDNMAPPTERTVIPGSLRRPVHLRRGPLLRGGPLPDHHGARSARQSSANRPDLYRLRSPTRPSQRLRLPGHPVGRAERFGGLRRHAHQHGL